MNLTVDFSKGLWAAEVLHLHSETIVTGLGLIGNIRSFKMGHKEWKFGVRVCCLHV